MKKAGKWFALGWHSMAIFLGGLTFILLVLWLQLGELVPGFSDNELTARTASSTYRHIIDNPLGLPFKGLQLIPQYLGHTGPAAMRSAAAVIGLFVVGCFYVVLRGWYTRRVALIGTFMFVSSAWFLHSARLGTDSIMYAMLFGVVACTVWLQRRNSWLAAATSVVLIVTLLYIPGMVWFVVPAIFWQISRLVRLMGDQNSVLLTIFALVGILAVAPLGYALYQDASLIRTFFGLPQSFPEPLTILNNIAHVPSHIFLRGPANPEMWLGRLPLLDWFASAMFVLGAYAFMKRRLDRTWLFLYVFVVGSVLIGLQGPVGMTLLLPFVYVFVAGGVAMLLQRWFKVFPVNPLARWTGAGLLVLAVGLASFYNLNHYFMAWPNALETKAVFHNKP